MRADDLTYNNNDSKKEVAAQLQNAVDELQEQLQLAKGKIGLVEHGLIRVQQFLNQMKEDES